METPIYLKALFIITTAITIWLFFKAARNSGMALVAILAMAALDGLLAFFGFFEHTSGLPPRLILAPALAVLCIVLLFVSRQGRTFLDGLDMKVLLWLHVVRIPVEIGLYLLFKEGKVPQLMTFEGSNPDILSGITAPIAIWLLYNKGNIKKWGLVLWNVLCLALLANIVARAALSMPSEIQQMAFEQPNVAILHFPYVWLPGVIVPLVLLAHLGVLRQLLKKQA
jgi:hypothetical protein